MSNRMVLILVCAALGGAFAVQYSMNRSLRSELAALRAQVGSASPTVIPVKASPEEDDNIASEALQVLPPQGLDARLAALEAAVAGWNRASDHLMSQGQLPATPEKLAEFRAKFLDGNASTRDRLAALRMLRRNKDVSPDVIAGAAAWLTTSTNSRAISGLLQGLQGLSDPALLEPICALATNSKDRDIQMEAMAGLTAYGDDPRVSELLWKLASTSESRDLRGMAGELLSEAGYSPETAATWQTRAMDESAPVNQRGLALRVMAEGGADISSIASSFVQAAQATTDKAKFLEWMGTFDDVNDPAFLAAIVQGVQSQDVDIRRRAADTLRDYRTDPIALQWLQYLSQSDPDSRVRGEATRGLGQRGAATARPWQVQ